MCVDVCMFININVVCRSATRSEKLPKQISSLIYQIVCLIWPSQSRADLVTDITEIFRETGRDEGE